MSEAKPEQAGRPRRGKSRVAATLRVLLRTRIMAGLLVVLPIYVTIWLLRAVFRLMRDSSLWVVEAYLRSRLGKGLLEDWRVPKPTGYRDWPDANLDFLKPEVKQIPVTEKLDFLEFRLGHPPEMQDFFDMLPEIVQWATAIVAVLLTIVILYAIGLFAANLLGRRVINTFESALDRVPLVKTVYRSTKQILSTFAGEQSEEFQRAALVPFPQEKMRSVGFITAIFNDSVTGEELAAVFIPTTPNPTTGYLQILKRKELVELDWSVEDAVRTIMSGGILRPDFLTIVPGAGQREGLPETKQSALSPPPDDEP
jgi:uncharacterized membrane protein